MLGVVGRAVARGIHSTGPRSAIPLVIETDGRVERAYDIYSRLLKDRIVCLMTPVDDFVASSIVAQLLFLQSDSAKKPIHMYINSPGLGKKPVHMHINTVCTPYLIRKHSVKKYTQVFAGGSVTAGLGIYDTMQYISAPVATWCIGQASSMGSLLLAAGEPGMRTALPNSRIMIHQPSGGAQGQASDILIRAEEIIKLRKRLNEIYAKHTGQKFERIEEAVDRDNFMSAEEARQFGIVDRVETHSGSIPSQ